MDLRVNLVIDQMVEFEHVHGADGNLFLERLSGTPVIKGRLTRSTQTGLNQQFFDFAPLWHHRIPASPYEHRFDN
jgi:hypothetical protein